jgi:hypothetical protein
MQCGVVMSYDDPAHPMSVSLTESWSLTTIFPIAIELDGEVTSVPFRPASDVDSPIGVCMQ